jgi:hypothetical protein
MGNAAVLLLSLPLVCISTTSAILLFLMLYIPHMQGRILPFLRYFSSLFPQPSLPPFILLLSPLRLCVMTALCVMTDLLRLLMYWWHYCAPIRSKQASKAHFAGFLYVHRFQVSIKRNLCLAKAESQIKLDCSYVNVAIIILSCRPS